MVNFNTVHVYVHVHVYMYVKIINNYIFLNTYKEQQITLFPFYLQVEHADPETVSLHDWA